MIQSPFLQINSFISVGGGNEPRIHEEVLGKGRKGRERR